MSIYKTLTNNFLEVRNTFPNSAWDEDICAFVDMYFKEVALKVYSNPEVLSIFDDSDYKNKIENNISKLYESNGIRNYEKFRLIDLLLNLKLNFPLINVFGMALANDDVEKTIQTWSYCVEAIWNEFANCLKSKPGRENTLVICKILDTIDEFESTMINFEFNSHNYIPLAGVDKWLGNITRLADEFLTHEDILELSKTAGKPTLIAMTSNVPESSWLASEFEKGAIDLANNPNLPSITVNESLQKKEWGLSDRVLLHPNANTELAFGWVKEILESDDAGEAEELANSLNEWQNVRDDGFRNFNSFRRTSESGQKILSYIKKWCEDNPVEGEEIYDMFF